MVIEGEWLLPYLVARAPNLPFGVSRLPQGSMGRGTTAFSTCYGVSRQSIWQEEAFVFADYLAHQNAPERRVALGLALPVPTDAQQRWQDAFPAHAPYFDDIDHAYPWRLLPGQSVALTPLNELLANVLLDELTPTEASTAILEELLSPIAGE